MNWKIIIGILLIFGGIKEFLNVFIDYKTGKLSFFPFGAAFGCTTLIVAGVFLIIKGAKERRK